jgi:hypothetical protein
MKEDPVTTEIVSPAVAGLGLGLALASTPGPVQAVLLGVGAKGRPNRIRLVHAAFLRGNVPPGGTQRRVYTFLPGWLWPCGHTVMCNDVAATTRIAARMLIFPG